MTPTIACERRVLCCSAKWIIFFCSSSCFKIFSLNGLRFGMPGSLFSFFRNLGFFFASLLSLRSCSLAFFVMLYLRASGVRFDVDPSFILNICTVQLNFNLCHLSIRRVGNCLLVLCAIILERDLVVCRRLMWCLYS
jgi:hypothetical protein